jgi:hypothetical protein
VASEWLASGFGSYDGVDTTARMLPVAGSIATTAPTYPLSFMAEYAACCTAGSSVSWTLPPRGSRPVMRSESWPAMSSGASPDRISFWFRSMPVGPYRME